MTPEEAREHLAWPEDKDHPKVRDGSGQTWFEVQAGESNTYWNRLPDAPHEDAVMYAVAQSALATIAGMREDWGVEATHYRDNDPHTRWGYTDRQDAEAFARYMDKDPRWNAARVVRRYVTTEEEIS